MGKKKRNSKGKERNKYSKDSIFSWRNLGKIAVAFLGISGLSIIWLLPKVSVSEKFLRDQKNILSTQFEIKNESNIPLNDVEFSVAICEIRTFDGLIINGDCNFKGRLKEPNSKENKKIPLMRSGEVNTVQFPQSFNIGSNIDFVDLAVVVNYRVLLLPFLPLGNIVRFVTVKGPDGKLYWTKQPLSKH